MLSAKGTTLIAYRGITTIELGKIMQLVFEGLV
jgi:hypothetical protein